MGGFLQGFIAAAALSFGLGATPVFAQTVTLKSADGSVTLSGELLGYDGEFYRLKTIYGEMVLNALTVTCQGLSCPDPGQYAADITISGARDIGARLLPRLLEDFAFVSGETALRVDHGTAGWTYFISDAAQVPVARIQTDLTNTAAGFDALLHEKADFVLATRKATEEESRAILDAGLGDLSNPYRKQILALDGLIFVVSKQNPVSAITLGQAADIFSGKIVNWSALGGIDAPIERFVRNIGSDFLVDFQATVFADRDDSILTFDAVFNTNDALSDAVANNPFAIGATTFSALRNAKPLAVQGECGIRTRPSVFALQSEDYPLTRRLYLYSAKRRHPVFARALLAWFETEAGQQAVGHDGYVSLYPKAIPLSDQQDRLSNAVLAAGGDIDLDQVQGFVRNFIGAARLSTTFRFFDNSTEMDSRSERNIVELARRIEQGDFDGHELIVAGFSDMQGGAEGNRRISRQRAEQVAARIRKAASRADLARLKIRVLGLGEVSPLACDDTALGRFTNRRVEVWVK